MNDTPKRRPKPDYTNLRSDGTAEDKYIGKRRADRARLWAEEQGLDYRYTPNANGCSGMYARTDCETVRQQTEAEQAEVALRAAREPFLAAIKASPNDALPRLVFAEWLEERGREAEAAEQRMKSERIRANGGRSRYVGTVPAELGNMNPNSPDTQRAWREHLAGRGKSVPDAPLVAMPSRTDCFKILTAST